MNKRWATGFTIVELLIVIATIAILTTFTIIAYNGIRQSTIAKAAQSDLQNVAAEMERTKLREGVYPSSLPSAVKTSPNITLTLIEAGDEPLYSNLTPVQNGVLFATICQKLVDEGVGQGVNQGGVTQNYITGCGNWNHSNMQFTGWTTKLWNTPVTSEQLVSYANNFTTSDTWNKSQEPVTKNFYNTLVTRFSAQGGTFPITSFWDYWANPGNGGVIQQPLDSDPPIRSFYCAEARANGYESVIWHIKQNGKLTEGTC